MISRRTFFVAAGALVATSALPNLAFAGYCGGNIQSMTRFYTRLDASIPPEFVMHPARVALDLARMSFETLHQTAAFGSVSELPYDRRSASDRQRFLDGLFALSSEMEGHMVDLHGALVADGVSGLPVEVLEMQIASFRGNYDERRPHMALAIAERSDPRVATDLILQEAVADLNEAVRTVGGGDPELAAKRAWAASYHLEKRHFLDFLPVVSAADIVVNRMAQLERGAKPLAA